MSAMKTVELQIVLENVVKYYKESIVLDLLGFNAQKDRNVSTKKEMDVPQTVEVPIALESVW